MTIKITVVTCLAHNSAPYADRLLENLDEFKSGSNEICYFALVSTDDIDHIGLPKYWKIAPVNTLKMRPTDQNATLPSVRHAKLLNSIPKVVPKDTDILVISDCDMFVFAKDWDVELCDALRGFACVGTPKHDGSLRMFLTAFDYRDNKYTNLNINWMPGVDKHDFVSRWFITDDGRRVVTDTGWRLEGGLINAHIPYTLFRYE